MNWTIVEDADYFLDMETNAKNRKRQRDAKGRYVPNSDRYDEDFVMFLEGLEEFWQQKFEGQVHDDDDDDDPSYMEFLRNLKEHGSAYMCDMPVEHGLFSLIVYEDDSDSLPIKRKISSSSGDVAVGNKKKKIKDDWRSHPETSNAPNIGSSAKCKRYYNSNSKNAHIHRVKEKTPISRRDDGLKEHPNLHVNGDQKSRPLTSSFGEQKVQEIDITYKKFLDNVHVKDGCVFYEYGDNKRIFYESSDQHSTDVKIDPLQADVRSPASTQRLPRKHPKFSPLKSPFEPLSSIPRPKTPPSREQVTTQRRATTTSDNVPSTSKCKHKGKPHKRFYSFWRELHECLTKPYAQEEFDFLMDYVSVRRPVSLYRGSRSGGTDKPGQLGRSFLQIYPDLNKEIKKVEADRYKVLNLLRMFRLYLQKIPSGVPKPWVYSFWKTILPESK